MNTQQKKLVANVVTVLTFTIAMVVGFANIKDTINRSEAMRAMNILSDEIFRYKQQTGSLPPTMYVTQYVERLGAVRLGNYQYRAQWIEFNADPNATILTYAVKNYRGLVKGGYVVMRLNGKVEWMGKKHFEHLLAEQQKKQELQWLQEHLQKDDK